MTGRRGVRGDGGGTYGAGIPALPISLKERLRGLTDTRNVLGCSVSVVTRDRTVYADAWGTARTGRPMTTRSTLNIGSVSKTVTATAVLQLVAAGRLRLDGDIDEVLRTSRIYGPRSVRSPHHPQTPITVRHLLTHLTPLTGGPEPGPYGYTYRTGAAPDPGEMGRWLHDFLTPAPRGWTYDPEHNFLKTVPGRAHQYSDIGFDLAGHLVQAVTGRYFADHCRDHVLRPAGMSGSDFERDRIPETHRARAHAWYVDGAKTGMWLDYRNLIPRSIPDDFTGHVEYAPYTTCLAPAGGLWSNAIDLARWARLWLGSGTIDGRPVLPGSVATEALTGHVSAEILAQSQAPLPFVSQGYAWHRLRGDADGIWQHAGSDLGTATYVMLDTKRGAGATIVCNTEVAIDADPRGQMLQLLLDAAAQG
ncbi:serine hydrolase domain-containing protein [Embleya sp. NPDC050493]|uniref:serine hydrolase domain-containing protein n=1 Tax=Embleya sp. NPDC050493 TaxID=3363989 RepID=UPI0037A10AFC